MPLSPHISSSNNLRLRNLFLLLRKWSTKEYTIALFTIILFFSLTFLNRSNSNHSHSNDSILNLIPFTPLTNFKQLGARILSSVPSQNPDFFNWNKVKIRYCDGASFAGHPESEQKGTGLFFRGQIIWEAIMNELLSIGMSKAKQALLSGCSAGGLATLIHCDSFRQLLPKKATVKCLADAGFFLDEKDIVGNSTMRSFYHDVVQLQGVAKSLHKECLAKMEPSKCLFPSEILKNLKTPVFLVHPAYDFWQDQIPIVAGKAAD